MRPVREGRPGQALGEGEVEEVEVEEVEEEGEEKEVEEIRGGGGGGDLVEPPGVAGRAAAGAAGEVALAVRLRLAGPQEQRVLGGKRLKSRLRLELWYLRGEPGVL